MGAQNPPSPAIYSGNFTALLTSRGIMNSNGGVNEYDGPWNYIPTGRFEQSTASAVLSNATLTSGLPTGAPSGGAASLSVGTNTTTPLIGGSSMQITAASAWAAGQGFSLPSFTVRGADLGKILTFSFYYQANTGPGTLNWSGILGSQSLIVYIRDVTNSVWIQPAGYAGMNTSTTSGFVSGTFQSSVTPGQQYQLYILASQASSGACSVSFDGIQITPQTIPVGSVVTDWTSYTPTTTGLGTITASQFLYRRVGSTVELQGLFTTGTVSAAIASVSLPPGIVASSSLGALNVSGVVAGNSAGVSSLYTLIASGATALNFGSQTGVSAALAAAAANGVFASSEVISFTFAAQVQGWGGSVQMSGDTDTRVVSANISFVTSTAVTANTNAKYDTVAYDTAGAYSIATGAYTCPTSGYYKVDINNQSGAANILLAKNGTQNRYICTATGGVVSGSTTIQCNAGDTLSLQPDGSVTFSGGATPTNSATFTRVSGPSVVAANESVNMRYFSSSTTITGSLATILYTTKGWDTHNAYNTGTGIYTAPVSGKYQVNASIAMTGTFILNSTLDLQVQQTGGSTQTSEAKSFAGGAVTQMNTNVGDIFYMNAGDSLKVQASNTGTAPVIAATTTQNWISIARVGN